MLSAADSRACPNSFWLYLVVTLNCVCKFGWQRKWVAMISLARNQWLSCVLRICLEPPVSSPKLCGRLFLCLTGRLHCCQCLFSGDELHRITLLLAKSDSNQRMEQRILVFRHEKFGMMLCCQLQILGHAQIVSGYICLWPSILFANQSPFLFSVVFAACIAYSPEFQA